MGCLVLLVGRRSERGGRLVAVRCGWGGGVIPLCGTGPLLTAFHQIGPLWERGAPLLVRPTSEGAAVGKKGGEAGSASYQVAYSLMLFLQAVDTATAA